MVNIKINEQKEKDMRVELKQINKLYEELMKIEKFKTSLDNGL